MTQAGYQPQEYDIFVGIDVDAKSFVCRIQDQYTLDRIQTLPAQPEQLYRYLDNRYREKRILCAYEAGPTGYYLYDYLMSNKMNCIMVSPLSIPTARNERVKTNKRDAQKLVRELKGGGLTAIRVPSLEYRELRHLVRTQELYSKEERKTKQRIKSLLLFERLDTTAQDAERHWSHRYCIKLKELSCSPVVRVRLDTFLEDLGDYRNKRSKAHKNIKKYLHKNQAMRQYMKYLCSIPGIGFITASTILANIGDPALLKDQREVAAFSGLVPCEHSTGEKTNRGSITHLGNRELRRLLIESSWRAIRKNIALEQFYYRIKQRHHPSIAARKAIVAVARKMTMLIYRVVKDQRMYQS